jgi:hypothetical protein
MAVDGIKEATGRDILEDAIEVELNVGEVEKLLWAARCEVLGIG